jgi:hypothetical protein
MSTSLSLIDAHKIFLVDVNDGNTDFYHQDLYIVTGEDAFDFSNILQSGIDFVLRNQNCVMELLSTQDEFQNPCLRIVLENWPNNIKLYCNIYDVKMFPNIVKEDFAKYLATSEITPKARAVKCFKEFLGDSELEADESKIDTVTVSMIFGKTNHKMKKVRSVTELAKWLMDFAIRTSSSLFFKIEVYPVFELHSPDKQVTQIWLNPEVGLSLDSYPHQLMEL